MEHQDWDTIYIKANRTLDNNNKGKKSNQKNNSQTKETKLEKKIEEGDLKIKKTPAEIGKLIQKKRTELNMTQKDLAQKINQTVKIINEIESGKAKHNPQLISKIKRILNISNK